MTSTSFTLSLDKQEQILNEEDGAATQCISLKFTLPIDPKLMTEEQKNGVVELFQLLHPYINCDSDDLDVPCLSAKEFKEFALDDCRLLTRCLYALGTGDFEFDRKKAANASYWASRRCYCVCASEMLASCHQKKPGRFQRFFSDQLCINPVTKNFKQVCSFLGLSESHDKQRRSNAEKVIDSILKGEEYPSRGLVIFGMDNFGLKEKVGYDQWTILQLIRVTEEQLKLAGFYKENANERISRNRQSIANLLEENSATGSDVSDHVVGIKAQDYRVLTKYVLTHIETALKLNLPSQKECEDMARTFDFTWPHSKIPKSLGLKLPENPKNQPATSENIFPIPRTYVPRDSELLEEETNCIMDNDFCLVCENSVDDQNTDREEGFDEIDILSSESESESSLHYHCDSQEENFFDRSEWPDPEDYKTLYARNNMVLDIPLHDDLAKVDVVKSLMDYALRVTHSSLHMNDPENGQELPVQTIMVPLTGDGSPVETSHRIKDADTASGENKYGQIRFFPGGFHFTLELHRIRGRFFEDVFGWFVSKWRTTAGRQKWIMEPADPNDLLEELYEYILAHYRCAADCVVELLGYDEVSPVQVNSHMLQRAASCPFAMAVLMELRFAEVTIILRDSEKSGPCGDVDLFLTGVRISMILFTVTHAVKYVRICAEFLTFWATSSDAEKLLFKKFIYTKISPQGHLIWADRCVEETMKHLRIFLGKHKGQGHDNKILQTVVDLPNLVKERRGAKEMLGHDETRSDYIAWNDHERPISNVFVQTYIACKKINLYGEGPIKISRRNATENQSEEDGASHQLFQTPAGDELNEEMLRCISIGRARANAYFRRFYIESQNQVSRTEVEMGLTGIQTTAQKLKAGLEKKLCKATSTNVNDLLKACTKKISLKK